MEIIGWQDVNLPAIHHRQISSKPDIDRFNGH
jgi:hypothetical protein